MILAFYTAVEAYVVEEAPSFLLNAMQRLRWAGRVGFQNWCPWTFVVLVERRVQGSATNDSSSMMCTCLSKRSLLTSLPLSLVRCCLGAPVFHVEPWQTETKESKKILIWLYSQCLFHQRTRKVHIQRRIKFDFIYFIVVS